MPGGDGTGPRWAGGGWGCRRGPGGAGLGFGAGRRYAFSYQNQSPQDDAALLKGYADQLASELEAVKKRLAELEKK